MEELTVTVTMDEQWIIQKANSLKWMACQFHAAGKETQ